MRDPGNRYWVASPPQDAWPRLVFVTVPERKLVKNRVHLDVVPREGGQDAELDRLLGLGATIVDDRRELTPGGWVVLAEASHCAQPSTPALGISEAGARGLET